MKSASTAIRDLWRERLERGVSFRLTPFRRNLRSNWRLMLGVSAFIAGVIAVAGASWDKVLLGFFLFIGYLLVIAWIASWGNVIELKSRKIRVADSVSPVIYFKYGNVQRITRRSDGVIELHYIARNKSLDKLELQPEDSPTFVEELSRRYEAATGRPLEIVG